MVESKLHPCKPQTLFEEALTDLQGIVDHQRRRAVGLQPDRGLLSFESFHAARHHEGQQHVFQAVHAPLSRTLPRR